jgi:hypothetical protein
MIGRHILRAIHQMELMAAISIIWTANVGRVEVIIKGPKPSRTTSLRSLCVNTGADGDPNAEMVLADLETSARESAPTDSVQAGQSQIQTTTKPHTRSVGEECPRLYCEV